MMSCLPSSSISSSFIIVTQISIDEAKKLCDALQYALHVSLYSRGAHEKMKRGRGLHEGCRVRCIVASQGQGVKNITSGGRFNRKTTPVSVLVLSSPGGLRKGNSLQPYQSSQQHAKISSSHKNRSRIEAVFLVMASSPAASTLQNKEASSQHNYFFGKKRLKIPLIH